MLSSIVKYIHLLFLIAYLTLAKAQASDGSAKVNGARPDGSTSENLVIAAATITPVIVFSVVFLMAALCKRPFGNKIVLITPALVLGVSPPFEDASSLGFKIHATPPDVIGEDNV